MRNLIIAAGIIIILSACSSTKNTAGNYEIVPDKSEKIIKGTITRSIIQNDTAFKWFNENMRYGAADASAVEAFKTNANNFSMIVFGGTWCHDTQNLLPVFYRLVDKSGYPENKITLVGVDRAKTAPKNLHKKYEITNVPTFIVIRNGKEIGRVVEYGKYGQVDRELGEIVASSAGR